MGKSKTMMLWRTLLVLFFAFFLGGNIHAEEKAWVKYADGTLTFQYGEKATLDTDEYWLNEGRNRPGWFEKRDDVTEVVFDASFAQARPTSCYYWFGFFEKLKSIKGVEYLNTSDVTNMGLMFYLCEGLTSLDVSHFNTTNVMDIHGMFSSCSKLTSLDVSHFDTSKVTDMGAMFYSCSGLTSLDVSNFNTSKVTDMGAMFYSCSGLTSLDVSNFNTSKVTNMVFMFNNCSGLTSLDVSHFDTSKVTDMNSMFNFCSGLTSLNLSYFNTSEVTRMEYMFCGCSNLTTIFASDKFVLTQVTVSTDMFKDCKKLQGSLTAYDESKTDKTYATINGGYFRVARPWVKYADGTLTFQYGEKATLNTGEYWLKEDNTSPGWSGMNGDVTAIIFDASFAQARPTSCSSWFRNCTKLKSIQGIEYLNTSDVKYMNTMFSSCSKLTSLDVSHFDTSNVTDMNTMFYNCSGLTSLDVSHFDTSNVNRIDYMFYGCSGLTTLDVSHFNTSNVMDIYSMFYDCSGLTTLDVSHFDTSKVTDMRGMFLRCSGLTSLDVSHFDTSNVNRIDYMFYGCSALKSIYFGDKFNVGNLSSISNNDMLTNCPATLYCSPVKYKNFKSNSVIASYGNAVKPYVDINSKSEYGTLCVPVGSRLAEGNYTGFDKLYTVTSADKNKGTITLTEAKKIQPGVAYVYHRNLAENAPMSVITFDVDDNTASVTTPNSTGMLKGSFESIVAPGGKYILQTDGNFHPVATGNSTLKVGAYRAYLDLTEIGGIEEGPDAPSNAFRMIFSDSETTGINGIADNAKAATRTEYFDLMGRKVNSPQKGHIYIKNGKKVMF